MSFALPKTQVTVGSQNLDVGDIAFLGLNFGCTKEVSDFDVLLFNNNKKYNQGATQISRGDTVKIYVGRDPNCPQLLTGEAEKLEYDDDPLQCLLWVRGRCKGKNLFDRHVTKIYENQKGEDIVKDLIDNYTSLSHTRNSTELIEDTDTTYVYLEYEDTPVWDLLRYIASSASKSGVIGFEMRVEYDGKFAFFPKESKTSPISLSERIEKANYIIDGERIRDYVKVRGAAEKSDPEDRDYLTDGEKISSYGDATEYHHDGDDWVCISFFTLAPTGSDKKVLLHKVQLDVYVTEDTGYYKITYRKEDEGETELISETEVTNTTYETKEHSVNVMGDIGKAITVYYYTRHPGDAGKEIYSKNHLTDFDRFQGDWKSGTGLGRVDPLEATEKMVGNYSICHNTFSGTIQAILYIDYPSPYKNLNKYPSVTFVIDLHDNDFTGELFFRLTDSADNTVGCGSQVPVNDGDFHLIHLDCGRKSTVWKESVFNPGVFDWEHVKRVEIFAYFDGSKTGKFYVDGFFLNKCRFEYVASDPYDPSNPKEIVEIIEELHSDNACELRAKALLAYYRPPLELVSIDSEVLDWANNHPAAADKLNVQLPNENLNKNFRIDSLEINVLPGKILYCRIKAGYEPPLFADFMFESHRKIGELVRGQLAK